jgi:hypothetical protein
MPLLLRKVYFLDRRAIGEFTESTVFSGQPGGLHVQGGGHQ